MANTTDIENLIRYENENSYLDFKATQYRREKHQELIKDVMAMANAFGNGERYIIFGIKHYSNGNRELLGIQDEEFIDSANYQQLVRENIEPELEIDYSPLTLDGKIFGVLSISAKDKPYLVKKDFANLKKGTCLIRKGTATYPISRSEIDQIYQGKYNTAKNELTGSIKISFAYSDQPKILELKEKIKADLNLTSQRMKEEIERILSEKITTKAKREETRKSTEEQANLKPKGFRLPDPEDIDEPGSIGGVPYEKRSINTLKRNLENVEETYKDDDIYELAMFHSFQLNFEIFNEGDKYLEDAYIQLRIHNKDNAIYVVPKMMTKPESSILWAIRANQKRVRPDINENYPNVKFNGELIIAEQSIGDIKHRIETLAFKKAIRIFPFFKINEPTDLELKCKIGGKNLANPAEESLVLRLIPANTKI